MSHYTTKRAVMDTKELFTQPQPLYTVPEVCACLRISKPTVYRMVKTGELKTKRRQGKKGSIILIPYKELKRYGFQTLNPD